jgi:hypothetical protein
MFSQVFFFTGLDAPVECDSSQQTVGPCAYFGLWRAMAAGSGVIVVLVLLLRMCKILLDSRRQIGVPQWLLADVVIRGLLTVAAVQASYFVLAYAMHTSIGVGDTLFNVALGAGGQEGMAHEVNALANLSLAPFSQILIGIMFVYLIVLIAASRIAMLFAIALGPLLIPLYAYSSNNDLITWWLRILAQGLLVPLAAGALLGVALLAIHSVEGDQVLLGSPVGTITTVAALWFVGHAIHKLLSYLFHGHKGVVEGVGLMGAAVMAVPKFVSVK